MPPQFVSPRPSPPATRINDAKETSVRAFTYSSALALLILGFLPASLTAQPAAVEPAHFHHVRLNVTDPGKTLGFYKRFFGAVEVKYRGVVPALFTERSYILLNKVDAPPPSGPRTALSHIGWAAVTGKDEYEWLKKQGVEFQTHLGQLGNDFGMYVYGPDKELVELWTGGKSHRFDHVHLWATDVEKTAGWLRDNLGLKPRTLAKPKTQSRENITSIWMSFTQCDNVGLVVFGKPDFDSVWWPGSNYSKDDAPKEFQPTQGSAIDHIAFSYRDITPVFERMKAAGVEIVEPIAKRADVGHTSFFVLAPDKLLVEIVQEKPIPDGSWE